MIIIRTKSKFIIKLLAALLLLSSAIYGLFGKINITKYAAVEDINLHNSLNVAKFMSSNQEGDEKKYIYLTFDDGPTNIITDGILDMLKKCEVKSTFFVIGKEIKGKETLLKRIKNEGHAIGLHTYSHSFKKIYRSNDNFIKEINETNDYIYDITGIKSKVIRFPGGSHGRLNDNLLHTIHSEGYKIFDWTHSCEDGVHPEYSAQKLFNNSLRKIISKKKAPGIILLMHNNENNQNTIEALPLIIKHYRDEGYTFSIIDEKTPEYYSE